MKNALFAYLIPLSQSEDAKRFAATANGALKALEGDAALSLVECKGGVGLLHSPMRNHLEIGDIVSAFTLLASVALECPCTLTWRESEVSVQGAEANDLLKQWRDGRRPPVLSIVRLVKLPLKNARVAHQTRGLRPFVGHELAIEISIEDQPVDALNTLVTMAGYALVLGPEYRFRPIYNAVGQAARLIPLFDPKTRSKVVKIEF